jgi:hypothetical protein
LGENGLPTAAWKEEAAAVALGQRKKGEERKKEEREEKAMIARFKLSSSHVNWTCATVDM